MTPDPKENRIDDVDHTVLDSTSSIDTTGIGILGGATAQVDVTLPSYRDDDDDDVVDDDDVDLGADEAVASDEDEIAPDQDAATDDEADADDDEADADEPEVSDHVASGLESDVAEDDARSADESDVAGADADLAAEAAERASEPEPEPAAAPESAEAPASVSTSSAAASQVAVVPAPASAAPVERMRPRTSEVPLQSRRLGDVNPSRESSDLLTADRLLDPARVVRPEPEGTWQRLVYTLSAHRINLGDSKAARERKELDGRVSAPLNGGAKFVPVLSRKGGVGKTTVTTLLGMALADARDDRVVAIDANPDRGTLAERAGGAPAGGKTVRDLVRSRSQIRGFSDVSAIVARDETRLDVLASDTDPHVSEAFSDADYREVAEIAAHYYSVVLTDTGTGIVHSVMDATLQAADQLVVVAGLSVDEARLASETLTWLESNGYADQVRSAVIVLNTSRPGAQLVRAAELETHFASRVRAVVHIPYDPHVAAGSSVSFRDLQPATRRAARELAAAVVEGLRAPARS